MKHIIVYFLHGFISCLEHHGNIRKYLNIMGTAATIISTATTIGTDFPKLLSLLLVLLLLELYL